MKTCSACKADKPLTDFHKRSSAKDGYQPQCKDCRKGWHDRDREKNLARSKSWHEANPERSKELSKLWRKANPEYDKEYRARNPEKFHGLYTPERGQQMVEWQRNNRDKVIMNERRQRARRRGSMVETIPVSDSFIKRFYGSRCLHSECSATTRLELDHVIPLNLGGAHTLENLQVLCKHHNASKGDRSCADYRTIKLVAVDPVSMTIIVTRR